MTALNPIALRKAAAFVEAINNVCDQFNADIWAALSSNGDHVIAFFVDGAGVTPCKAFTAKKQDGGNGRDLGIELA